MHTLGRPDYPMEAACRAHSIAERLLRDLRDYCVSPTSLEDLGKDFEPLLSVIKAASRSLDEVSDLLKGAWNDAPNPRLLDALRAIDGVVVDVHVATCVQVERGTETDLIDLRRAIGKAMQAPPAST